MKRFTKQSLFTFSLVVGIYLITPYKLLAQSKNIIHGDQQWFQYYNTLILNPKWDVSTDGGMRYRDGLSTKSQFIVRSQVGYNASESLHLAAGMGYLGYYIGGKQDIQEFRPHQAITMSSHAGKVKLANRLRIEEQFFSSLDRTNLDYDRFNFRFRYRLMLTLPLISFSQKESQRKLSLNLGDELFLKVGKEVTGDLFDQNRFLVGPSYQLNESLGFTLLYQHQYSSSSEESTFIQRDIFWLGINHAISLK